MAKRIQPRVPVQCVPINGDDPLGQGLVASLGRVVTQNLSGRIGTVLIGRSMSVTSRWHGDTAPPQDFHGAGGHGVAIAQHNAALPNGQAPPALRNEPLLDALFNAQGG